MYYLLYAVFKRHIFHSVIVICSIKTLQKLNVLYLFFLMASQKSLQISRLVGLQQYGDKTQCCRYGNFSIFSIRNCGTGKNFNVISSHTWLLSPFFYLWSILLLAALPGIRIATSFLLWPSYHFLKLSSVTFLCVFSSGGYRAKMTVSCNFIITKNEIHIFSQHWILSTHGLFRDYFWALKNTFLDKYNLPSACKNLSLESVSSGSFSEHGP